MWSTRVSVRKLNGAATRMLTYLRWQEGSTVLEFNGLSTVAGTRRQV